MSKPSDDHVTGQPDGVAGCFQQPGAHVDHVLLQQRLSDRVTEGRQECEAHPAADEQGVHFWQQRLDHGQLVGYLRAAQHYGVGPLRRLGEPAQGGQLLDHQRAGIAGQPLGNLDD
jgi:hypothetical protein